VHLFQLSQGLRGPAAPLNRRGAPRRQPGSRLLEIRAWDGVERQHREQGAMLQRRAVIE
jgi:hypothetical protein